MSADWAGAWGQIVGAVGTFIAVAVALWIAIRETTARRREGDERARAQARLVVVERPEVVNVNRDIEPDSIHHGSALHDRQLWRSAGPGHSR
jgi:large-conductance mechanosensitive channel